MKRLAALLLPAPMGLAAPQALLARAPDELVEIEAGQPLTLRPDRAYILFRRIPPEGVTSIEPTSCVSRPRSKWRATPPCAGRHG